MDIALFKLVVTHDKLMRKEDEDVIKTDESKYIQQHLANERTFLAWVRTVVSVMGVGFVTTTLHFELLGGIYRRADLLIKIIGLFTLGIAFTAAIFCAHSYLDKRVGINESNFKSSMYLVIFLSAALLVVLILMAVYLTIVY